MTTRPPAPRKLTVLARNGIGEEYGVDYDVICQVSDRDGVRVIIGRCCESGMTMALVLGDDDRQLFASGPADERARERALYYADGYRAGVQDGHASPMPGAAGVPGRPGRER